MAKQVINFGTTINDGTGDNLRVGAQKINNNFTELYNLLGGSESISIVTNITAGPGLVASSSSGDITVRTLLATTTEPGAVIVGAGVDVDEDGVISVPTYSLPKAATNILGGIKVGDNLTINNEGVLSAVATPYTLPTASPTVKGGVKIGNGLEIVDGVLNVTTSEIAAALQSGIATVSLIEVPGQTYSILQSNFGVELNAQGTINSTKISWADDLETTTALNQVIVNASGITIENQDIETETTVSWNFGISGILEFPGGSIVDSSDDNFEVRNSNNINFEAASSVNIYTDIATDGYQWQFTETGATVFPGSIEINGDTTAINAQLDQLYEDGGLKSDEVNDIQNQIGSKQSELAYWQGIVSSGPENPQYGQAMTRISELNIEIGILQGTLSVAQGELAAIQNSISDTQLLLANPSVTLTYVVEDGVLDINNGAVRFPDGTIQTTAYLGTALPEVTVDRLTNGANEVVLDAEGVLTVAGAIYSTSNISVESITDTSITAGTDLKLYSSGLFALRNYSTTDSVAISTQYNSEDENNWLFNANGTITFPDSTVQTTAYVSNITNTTTEQSTIITPGSIMSRGYLSVRIEVLNTDEVNVEFNYSNPEAVVKVSGNNGTTNFFNGSTVLAQANEVWTTMTTSPLILAGDSVTALISDHSYGKFYRITAMYRDIPDETTLASVYCIIEELA